MLHYRNRSCRVAHTAELAFVLHDRKLGFYSLLSHMTFHRLFPPTSSFPSRLTRPPSLSLPPCEFPGQLKCSVPGMSACMAALPECILRQPACFSMGIEARYDSQIRYLTKRATHKSGAEAWEECVDSSQREPDRPLSFHLVNRLLFQRYCYFKEISISQHQKAHEYSLEKWPRRVLLLQTDGINWADWFMDLAF